MVETTTIVEGEGVAQLPELIKERFPRAFWRHYEDMWIVLIERLPRWFGCSSVTAVVYNALDEKRGRLYILQAGGWFPFAPRTSQRRYRHGSAVFREIQTICDAKSWSMGDIWVHT